MRLGWLKGKAGVGGEKEERGAKVQVEVRGEMERKGEPRYKGRRGVLVNNM